MIRKFKVVILIIIYLAITRGACVIKSITGIPCPGCGLTRAYLALLHGDIKGAWNFHPLFWFIGPLIIFIFVFREKLQKNKKAQMIICSFSLVLIIGVYIYRMIKLFPDTAPMDYYKGSLFYRIYRFIML